MRDDSIGCVFLLAIPAMGLLLWLATNGAERDGRDHAHAEYRECLSYRKAAPSDTVVLTMQPKCEKWLRPETVK